MNNPDAQCDPIKNVPKTINYYDVADMPQGTNRDDNWASVPSGYVFIPHKDPMPSSGACSSKDIPDNWKATAFIPHKNPMPCGGTIPACAPPPSDVPSTLFPLKNWPPLGSIKQPLVYHKIEKHFTDRFKYVNVKSAFLALGLLVFENSHYASARYAT